MASHDYHDRLSLVLCTGTHTLRVRGVAESPLSGWCLWPRRLSASRPMSGFQFSMNGRNLLVRCRLR